MTVTFNSNTVKTSNPATLKLFLKLRSYTCRIFISTTPSLDWSVPTNLAWVTASAMFSTVAGIDCRVGSKTENYMVVTCVCVGGGFGGCACMHMLMWERGREGGRQTETAAATFCFLWFVNVIMFTDLFQTSLNVALFARAATLPWYLLQYYLNFWKSAVSINK